MIPGWPSIDREKFLAQKTSLAMRFQGFAGKPHSRPGSEIILLTPYGRINGFTACEVPAEAAAFLHAQSRRVGTLLNFTDLKIREDLTMTAGNVEISDAEKFKFEFTDHFPDKKKGYEFLGKFVQHGENLQPVAMHGETEARVRLFGHEGKSLATLLDSEFGRHGRYVVPLYNMREVENLVFEQAAPRLA